MNKFLKEMAVLYDKLNKSEGFACFLVIDEIERLYKRHVEELVGNSSACTSPEITDIPRSPQYITKFSRPENPAHYKEYIVGPLRVLIPTPDVGRWECMTKKDREDYINSLIQECSSSSDCKYR